MNNILEHPEISRVLATGYSRPRQNWGNPDADAIYEERRQKQLFPQKEESPCESCWRQNICDNGCERWEQVYLQRQKRINNYAKALWKGQSRNREDVFAYSHPDLVRRYEKTHPCGGCRLRKECRVPCGRYIHWYDLRMEQARKRSGMLS